MALSISIESAKIIAHSSLNIHNDSCPICKNDLSVKCIECAHDTQNIECISVIGTCSHGFHLHCIKSWLKTKNRCPLDNGSWEFQKHNHCAHEKPKLKRTNAYHPNDNLSDSDMESVD